MTLTGRLAALALSTFVLTGCATMNVSSHVEPTADFARYTTYDWGPADALPTGDPRLDNSPFFNDYMQGAVEKQFAAHQVARVKENGTPDLLVHYHANVSQRIDVNRIDRQRGYCADDDCQARVSEYDAGTLVIDIVDTRTNRVVWRGWAQSSFEGVIDNQGRLADVIQDAVAKMMARFPQ
jgi:hypothetical protein